MDTHFSTSGSIVVRNMTEKKM